MPNPFDNALFCSFALLKQTLAAFCLISVSFDASAQVFLSLRNNYRPVQQKFFPGDELLFCTDGEKLVYHGTLEAIYDSVLVIDGIHLDIARISSIVRPRAISRGLTYGAWSAIPFFLTITALNRGINLDESPLIDNPTWRLSGVFAGLGTLPLLFRKKVYRVGKKWSLKRIDTFP
jgi:hypothetical protein